MRFVVIPYNSDYYNFELQSRDREGQSIGNGYSIMLQFVTNEHVLNFISIKDAINNQLQHAYENRIFFPEVERSTNKSVIRKLRRAYKNKFHRVNHDPVQGCLVQALRKGKK